MDIFLIPLTPGSPTETAGTNKMYYANTQLETANLVADAILEKVSTSNEENFNIHVDTSPEACAFGGLILGCMLASLDYSEIINTLAGETRTTKPAKSNVTINIVYIYDFEEEPKIDILLTAQIERT